MRFVLVSFLVTACSADVAAPSDPPASVRERLEREATSLAVIAPESAGAVTAQRRANGGWSAGLVDLRIESGELIASAADDGAITVEHLAIAVGPIDIPESVLGYGAQLTDIEVSLVAPTRLVTTWDGNDAGTAFADLDLALAWSLVNHGSTSPLGSPNLPPVPVELVVTGNGELVRAELRVRAPGELWSWADLIKLEDLTLIVAAATP
jgi:hypothetical protein